jgi:hypothetical protein
MKPALPIATLLAPSRPTAPRRPEPPDDREAKPRGAPMKKLAITITALAIAAGTQIAAAAPGSAAGTGGRTHPVFHHHNHGRPVATAAGVAGPIRPGSGSKPGVGSGADSPPAKPGTTTKPK